MVLLQQIARLTVKADQHDEQRGTFSRRQEISLVQSAGDLVQVDTKTVEVIVKGIL